MAQSDVLPRFRAEESSESEVRSAFPKSSSLPRNNIMLDEHRGLDSSRNRPWLVLGLLLLLAAAAVVAVDPGLLLGVTCGLAWLFAELSVLPAVVKANARGRLDPGENAYPWIQNWVSSLARIPYFFNAGTHLPNLVCLNGFLALGISSYTGFVALRISQGGSYDKLAATSWLGIMSMALMQWLCSREVQGALFVVSIAMKNVSLLYNIPYAIQHRDGSKFSDGKMLAFNLVNALVWLAYANIIRDYVLVMNNVIVIVCIFPCLVLKLILSPKLLGKPKERTSHKLKVDSVRSTVSRSSSPDSVMATSSGREARADDLESNITVSGTAAMRRLEERLNATLPKDFVAMASSLELSQANPSASFPFSSVDDTTTYDSGESFSSKCLLVDAPSPSDDKLPSQKGSIEKQSTPVAFPSPNNHYYDSEGSFSSKSLLKEVTHAPLGSTFFDPPDDEWGEPPQRNHETYKNKNLVVAFPNSNGKIYDPRESFSSKSHIGDATHAPLSRAVSV